MSLNATTSEYQFTPMQTNMLSAPIVGQYFAEQDMVYARDNSSTKAQFGLSSHDQQSYDAANYYMFNPSMELGVDCGRANEAAGRPNLNGVSSSGGGACYPMSTSAQRASLQLDANFNAFGPSAEQVILAEGDIRYAPARFVDQNNYVTPSMSDFTYQPRLMGTRDDVQSGCANTAIDQTIGNSSMCAIEDDPLPYFRSSDPRTLYGVDEPHSSYWSTVESGGVVGAGCGQLSEDYMLDTSVCNLQSVETGMPPRIPPQYGNVNGNGNGNNMNQQAMNRAPHQNQHARGAAAAAAAAAASASAHAHMPSRNQPPMPRARQQQAPASRGKMPMLPVNHQSRPVSPVRANASVYPSRVMRRS